MLIRLAHFLFLCIVIALLLDVSDARRSKDKSRSKNRKAKGKLSDSSQAKGCNPKVCQHDGVCIVVDGQARKCRCRQGYTGDVCQLRDRDHPILAWVSKSMATRTKRPRVASMLDLDCRIQYRHPLRDYGYTYSIHWLKNGLPVKFNRRYKNLGSRIEVTDLRPPDGGNYTCVIEAGGHEMHWSYFVEVKTDTPSRPYIILSTENQTVMEGSRVVFNCQVSPYASAHDLEMIWLKHIFFNGSFGQGEIRPNDSYIDVLMNWNTTQRPLVLDNVKPEDQGTYTCGFRNSIGKDWESTTLTVTTAAKSKSQSDVNVLMTIVIIASAFVLFGTFITALVCVRCCKLRKLGVQRTPLYYSNKDDSAARSLFKDRRISSSSSCSSSSSSVRSRTRTPSHDPWEFPRHKIQLQGLLGEGAFGQVNRAMAQGIGRVPKSCQVAVKTIKNNASKTEEMEFVKELEVMIAVREMGSHLNVINFLGYCTRGGPLWVIEEFAEKGNLKDFLVSLRSQVNCRTDLSMDMDVSQSSISSGVVDGDKLSQKLLVSFCHQIARGMEFLASVKCIHRDLAARNVLVTKENVLKIADFGLARNGDYYKKTSSGQLPIKWMPPEALLHMIYTEKSDVWSFGIVMWEMFSLGGMPYACIRHEHLYMKLIEGYRMERPHFAPESLYDTMKRCWNHLPEDRPDFSILVLILERQLVRIANGGYIEVLADDEEGAVTV